MADTNGTPTPGNGKIGYGPIPGYMQKCAGCGLVIGHPSTSERCPCEAPMPPGEDWCSPLRAPPKAHHLPSEPPARCTCPDDSHRLADGSCDRCRAPPLAVYERAEPKIRRRVAPEPATERPPDLLAALVIEIQSAVHREIEPLRREIAKLRGEDQPEGVTMAEAARRLHVSLSTIERRVADRTIPSKKIGKVRRVLLDAILPPRDPSPI